MNWNLVLIAVGFALMLAGSLRAFPTKTQLHFTVGETTNVEFRDERGQWKRITPTVERALRIESITAPGGPVLDADPPGVGRDAPTGHGGPPQRASVSR